MQPDRCMVARREHMVVGQSELPRAILDKGSERTGVSCSTGSARAAAGNTTGTFKEVTGASQARSRPSAQLAHHVGGDLYAIHFLRERTQFLLRSARNIDDHLLRLGSGSVPNRLNRETSEPFLCAKHLVNCIESSSLCVLQGSFSAHGNAKCFVVAVLKKTGGEGLCDLSGVGRRGFRQEVGK